MILKMARTELISSLYSNCHDLAEMQGDVLSSLQLMQDYGVNFVCVERWD